MTMLKAAVIGSGQIAQTVHIPAYQSMPELVELIGVSDVQLSSAQSVSKKFGVPHAFGDHKEMLEKLKPDIVSVCTPNKFHHPIVTDCLKAGCHVFCEKPPAITLEQAEDIHQLAASMGKVVSYNFHHRFRPEITIMGDMLRQGQLGHVYAAEVQAVRRRAIPGWGNFLSKELQGGGALIDLGIHMLDSALYLLNFPTPVYACASMFDYIGKQGGTGLFGAWDKERFTVEDCAMGFVVFENNLTLSLTTSFALHTPQTETTRMNLHFYGENAGLSLQPLMLYQSEGAVQVNKTIPFSPQPNTFGGVINFVQAIVQGTQPVVTSQNVLLTQKIVDALYQSAAQNQPIYF